MIRRLNRRKVATIAVVVILVASAWVGGHQTKTIRAERDTNGQAAQVNAESADKGGEVIVDICKAAPEKSIKAAGRTRECDLAEKGKIKEVLPVVTPTVRIERVSQADIEQAVDDYLSDYLTDLPALYRADLRASVVDYLKANPPKDGKAGPPPSMPVVAAAVVDYLQKNPPKPGKDGQAGVSVKSVTLDGCDLVFTYSDDSTNRVGPVCGPSGKDAPGATAAELRAAVDAYCADQPGGNCEGKAAAAGYPTGWRNSDGDVCTDPDGDHFYNCEAPPPPSSPPPSSSPPITLPTG